MRRWYATSNMPINGNNLHVSVENLCKRVLKSQIVRTDYLHDTVNLLIDKHQATLANHFGLEPRHYGSTKTKEDIWQKLAFFNKSSADIRSRRHDLLQLKNQQYRAPQVPYNNFVRALYPHLKKGSLGLVSSEKEHSSFVDNAIKYELINHDLVFRYYCELPHPATSYMKPNHLDDFLSRFLYRRDFIKPNSFSSSYTRSASVMYSTYNDMIEKRAEHLDMCTKILNDMKASGLPLSIEEQNQFMFMSFFKDRADIIEKAETAIKQLSESDAHDDYDNYSLPIKNDFDFSIYKKIKSQFEDGNKKMTVESYNTLLFISMRHNQHNIVNDILSDLGLIELLNRDCHFLDVRTSANRETIELLLDYFASKAFQNFSNDSPAFVNTINYLSNSRTITPDIKTLNKVIKGLTNMKHIEEAEYLVSKLFIDSTIEETEQISCEGLDSLLSIYKGLTPDDKQLYKKLLRLYDHLKEILCELKLEAEPYKLVPNESTFRPLIYSYCAPNNDKSSFQKSVYIISVIENYGLPITTRIFHALFSKFIEINKSMASDTSGWNLEELSHITLKLINAHDRTYSPGQDMLMRNKVEELLLSAQLKSFVKSFLNENPQGHIPKERGRFVKLSDSIMHQVYQAYIAVLSNDPTLTPSQRKEFTSTINLLRRDLLNDIKSIRQSNPLLLHKRGPKQMVFINDEINYIKKGFLIDLIDQTYSI